MSSSGGGKRGHEDGPGGNRKGIRWDEQNLEENERIKKELNPRKIDEPKTPYLSPMDTDEEGDLGHRTRPLSLDDPTTAAAAAAAMAAAADAGRPGSASGRSSDEAGTSGSGRGSRGRHVRIGGRAWSDSDRTVSPSPRHPDGASPGRAARSPRFSDQYYDEHEEHEEEEDEAGADPHRLEKRRRFKEARKQHYNMREQLARARELLEESDEGEDPAAAERQQPDDCSPGRWEQQRQQAAAGGSGGGLAANGDVSEGHLDADVESEQERGSAAARRGAAAGGLAAAPAGTDAMGD